MLLDRRAFLRSLGILGGSSLLSSCTGAPLERLYAYLEPPRELTPGVASWYASVCRACPAGCGVLARLREGRPVKLEGNPHHPVNRGRLCSRGQTFLQGLYGPHRLRTPRLRKDGELVKVSWKEALGFVAERLKAARSTGLLTGLERGTFDDLVADLRGAFPGLEHRMFEPVALGSSAAASRALFGRDEVPRVDLSEADRVVSFGADFLDAWVSPVELSRQWAERHGFRKDRRQLLEYFGPRRNLTANAADRWHRVRPADVPAAALALLHGVLAGGAGKIPEARLSSVRSLAAKLGPPPKLAEEQAREIKRLASRLVAAERGLVLCGGAEVLGPSATVTAAATLLTNVLTGAVGSALLYGEDWVLSHAASGAEAADLWARGRGGDLDLLFVHGADPVATLPGAAAVKRGAKGLVVVMGWEVSATKEVADVVLPVHHPLESWGDYQVSSRVLGLMQPVRQPLHVTKHAGDLMIELAGLAGRPLPRKSYRDYVVARWSRQRHLGSEGAAPTITGATPSEAPTPEPQPPPFVEKDWERSLAEGGVFEEANPAQAPSLRPDAPLPRLTTPAPSDGATLITPMTAALYDGRAWTQPLTDEIPDSLFQLAWERPLEVPFALAAAKGIKHGDLVRVTGPGGEVFAKAYLDADLEPGTVALRMGAGQAKRGAPVGAGHALGAHAATPDPLSGEMALVQPGVKLERVGPDKLVGVSGGVRSEGRSLALVAPLKEARAGRFPVLTRHGDKPPGHEGEGPLGPLPMPKDEKPDTRPKDNVVKLQPHPEHRWGLVIDLDRCTGCGACVSACYIENNVPVVGREEAALGRELAWLRIEKHVFGEGKDSEVRFLPVMCQQCDNAPCEVVCPVFAPHHTSDGLNAQIYNRCIGTRYCSNNCPYKVRRFNYFDYAWDKPENQRLNPDVTVRSRGVMEKCTFCIQRIRDVGNKARAEGRPIKDGEIKPACVQTCPTDALSFGDHLDQDSEMARRADDPRAYRLLDFHANTRPGVVYLRRVVTGPEEI